MRINQIFKIYDADDYVRTAEEAAAWIKTTEEITPYGKRWKPCPDSDEDFSDFPLLTPKALYGGSAGVALFYLRLWQVTGCAGYFSEAEAAASDIIATYEGRDFYTDVLEQRYATGGRPVNIKKKYMPGWFISFGNGPTGGAYLAKKLYDTTGREEYKNHVLKTADDILAVSKTTPDGNLYWSGQNDVSGDGGLLYTLIYAWRLSGDRRFIDAAAAFGRYVEAAGKSAPNGGRYWILIDLSRLGFPKDAFFVNWGHGTAGIGWIFAILYEETKDELFLRAARDAAEYIKGIAIGDDYAILTPYLDSLERGPSTEFYYLSTCHGPAGTSLLFEALYKITGEKDYLEWVKRLSRGIIEAGAPEHYSRGYWPSNCYCCGTAGLLEHFVRTYRLTGEEEFLEYAKRSASCVISQSFTEDSADIYKSEKKRLWYGSWTRTNPADVHSYTGLYIGTAGNAWSLLTMAGLERGENYVELPEHDII